MRDAQAQRRNGQVTPAARLFSEAVAHHQAARFDKAERLYRQISTLDPTHAEAWSNLGLLLIQKGAYAEAESACRRALSIRPAFIDAYLNLVTALERAGAYDKAADAYRQLIPLTPKRADLWNNFGLVLTAQGNLSQSVLAFREAMTADPSCVDAHFNMARGLSNLGWIKEAIQAYGQVIALDPNHAAACSNLSALLGSTGQFNEAIALAQRAASLAPQHPEIFCNLGVALQKQGRVNEAVAAYEKAIALRPDYPAALGNIAAGLQEQYRFDEAAEALKKAIALDPDFDTAVVELIKIRRHTCDWSAYEEDHQRLLGFIAAQKDLMFMLLLMSFPSTPGQQLDCARLAMKKYKDSVARLAPRAANTALAKIKIGYLSTDFRDHPVGRLVPEIFARHDRTAFEVIGYSLGLDDTGVLRTRIKQACDGFVDLHHMSNAEAAHRIQADGIDILVDLTGPTIGSRPEILAMRPAPVQVSYLGWPGSMGVDFIDYVIADAFVAPETQQPFYSEKIVHLADCYQPSDPQRPVPAVPPTREACGLPEDAFVFCSFNNPNKITPDMFDLWMRLLARVDNSVLWLYCKSQQTIANLKRRAAAQGIAEKRIVFASVARYEDYLGRLRQADLFLDSTPYNAGATCNDALWVGLPVLTCAGETYVSRMAGSLLTAAGLTELITYSLNDYEALAIRLATEPGLLADLRHRLMRSHADSALFDMARYTRSLETAYRRMHEINLAGKAPRFIPAAPAAAPSEVPAAEKAASAKRRKTAGTNAAR